MPNTTDHIDNKATLKMMLAGFVFAVLLILPHYAWIFNESWGWVKGFPLGWLGGGLSYMITFFHEIGHTLFAWFYGYPAIPMFDFQHGGGFSFWASDQQYLILGAVYLFIVYGIVYFKDARLLQIILACVLLFNLVTAFNEDARFIIIDFMGPGFVPFVAVFFLIRALFDLAPRGGLERFLNALLGFAMIFSALVDGYGLIKSQAYRLVYYQQKGSHGFGDFDKIESRLYSMDFNDVVYFYMGLNVFCLIVPFLLYAVFREKY